MIVINAEFYIVPEQKKQFLNEISELIQASRKEEKKPLQKIKKKPLIYFLSTSKIYRGGGISYNT